MRAINFLWMSLFIFSNRFVSCTVIRSTSDALDKNKERLVFAHVIFRHGDRTPIDPYPTDPYKDRENWPEGYGQLTNIGKEQHWELGKYFRHRYQRLLGDGEYSIDKVYIRSTDVDRTLMSAESNLAGLFPPNDGQIWNKEIPWQPIPIHTTPEALDMVLAAKKPCSRYKYAMKLYKETPEYRDLLDKHKYLLQYLEINSGSPVEDLHDIEYLYNTLWIESLKNKTLPDWTKKVFFSGSEMEKLAHYSFVIPTKTPELARLKSGFLIGEMLDRFQDKINGTLSPDRSLWIYSAHDTTVANFLNSLGLFTHPHNPPYASSVLIELYHHREDYFVKIFYKNSTDGNIPPLNIPNCGYECPLSKFRLLYKEIIPTEDFATECHVSLMSMTYEGATFSVYEIGYITFICFIFAILLVVFTAWKYCHRERSPKRYAKL